jgi:hypothetical protein
MQGQSLLMRKHKADSIPFQLTIHSKRPSIGESGYFGDGIEARRSSIGPGCDM